MNKQHAQLIARLESSADELKFALAQLTTADIMRVPKEDEWSLHATLSHLRDTEEKVFLYRTRLILAHDAPPTVANFDGEAYQAKHYRKREPLSEIMTDFRAARRKIVKLLRETSDKDWARYAIHPKWGKMTLEFVATYTYNHTLEHLQQVVAAREQALLQAANS